jgi:azurin
MLLKRNLTRCAAIGATLFAVTHAFAAGNACSITVIANDAMQYDVKEISVPKTCKEMSVVFKNAGKLARNVMGHNWVLAKTSDVAAVNADGMAAGLDKQHVKPGDSRVIAATKVLGPGESETVKIAASKIVTGQDYTFFCSFPGHSGIMKGSFALAK